MNQRDKAEIIDAIQLFTGPVVAEFRAYRAEVNAARAEVLAWRAESKADFERLEGKVDALDSDVAAITRHIFGGES